MWASLPFASSPEHCLPHIQFLFIGSRLFSTLLSDLTSRFGPCASLSLHLHLVVKRTCTSKLSDMLGTPKTKRTGIACPFCFFDRELGVRNEKFRQPRHTGTRLLLILHAVHSVDRVLPGAQESVKPH